MNPLIDTLNAWGEQVLGFAWPMLWQSSLLIAIVSGLDLLTRRRVRPAVRYTLWLLVGIKLVLPPSLALPTAAAFWLRPAALAPAKPKPVQWSVSYGEPSLQTEPVTAPVAAPVQMLPPAPRLTAAAWGLASVALVGLGLVVWMCRRWYQVTEVARDAAPAPEVLSRLLPQLPPSRLKVTDTPQSPAVCGLFRPVVLVPRRLVEELAAGQLRAVLLHEWMHLRRGDVWVNCVQALLQVVYWWHPLVWLANARLRRLREEAVDDAVMVLLEDEAEEYAPTLLEVAKLGLARPLASLGLVGILESHHSLRDRIERLLEWRAPRKAGLTLGAVVAVASFAAVAVPMGQAPGASRTPRTAARRLTTNHPVEQGWASTNRVQANPDEVGAEKPIEIAPFGFAGGWRSNVVEAAVDAGTNSGQRIRFANPVYDFGRVKSGDLIKHVFIFTNSGDQCLEIRNVHTSCGCTTAGEWTKNVEPGQTGIIPVQFNTANYSGAADKVFTVVSSDRTTPHVVLHLKGTIWKPVDVTPRVAALNVSADSQVASTVVKIVNNTDEPLRLFDVQSSERGFVAELRTNVPGKEFALVISTIPPLKPGPVQGSITLRTSFTNVPVISVTAFANVPPLLAVAPPRLTLPPTPLAKELTFSVMIQNNSTNPVTLTEPSINVPNAEVQLCEAQPGRAYVASMKFPRGFDASPDQSIEFTCKSSHEKQPVIKVPVLQPTRPATNKPVPQVNIKARFFEMSEQEANRLWRGVGQTNETGPWSAVLTASQTVVLMKNLELDPSADCVASPEVTLLSGRQCQMKLEEYKSVITGVAEQALKLPGITATNDDRSQVFKTEQVEFGPVLDVIPTVLDDGFTVMITAIPTLTKFLGYADPTNQVAVYVNGKQEWVSVPQLRGQVRQTQTDARVWDGQTLMLGNLMDGLTTNNVPVEKPGDGRPRLIVLVTATLIDAAGNRIHSAADMPFAKDAVPNSPLPHTIRRPSNPLNP